MINFEIKGIPEFEAQIRELVSKFPGSAKRGLYLGLEFVMTNSKQSYVPVDMGVLRASGYVFVEDDAPMIRGTIGFGGPAGTGNFGETNDKDVNYAIVQHENLDYAHKVGEAKYLERPLFEGIPMIGEIIVEMIHKDTGIS